MGRVGYYGCGLADLDRPATRARTAADVAIVLGVVAAVVAIAAHGPTHLYAYAQLKRIGTAIAMLETGDWLLPANTTGGIPTKPQLYSWLAAMGIRATGSCDDLVFRWPTIAASAATAVVVYLLACRWYGRRVAVLSGCLWAGSLHMGRMMYLAATDMLLAGAMAGSVFCADRLLWHRAPRRARWKWAVGLWATMIVGALAKGWGVVNLALVGGMVALAQSAGPGFGAVRSASGWRTAGLTF